MALEHWQDYRGQHPLLLSNCRKTDQADSLQVHVNVQLNTTDMYNSAVLTLLTYCIQSSDKMMRKFMGTICTETNIYIKLT